MRKEIFKKYSSAALALGLAATAVLPTTSLLAGKAAAEGETPKIVINNFVAGETYNAYKIFDLTHSGSSAVAYTIDSDWAAFFGSGGDGAEYIVDNNIFSCSDTTYTTKETCEAAHETWSGLNQIIVNGAIKYMNITEANKADFAQDALEYTSGLTADGSTTPAEGATSAEISGEKITLGYYLVYNGGIKTKGNWKTLAALDSAMPEATVEPKAIFPKINKTDDDPYVEVGQVAKFTIDNIVVPDTTGYSSYEYVVTDTMTEGLTFADADLTNLTVKFGNTAISTGDNFTKAKNGNGFILTFKKGIFAGRKGETIVITYNATVNEKAVDATSTNTVELKYNVDPRDLTKTKTGTASVNLYSSKIDIHKHDTTCEYNATTCKLANAKFILKKVVENTTYYYQAFANGEKKTLLNNVSETSLVTRVNWTTNKEKATVLVTDNSGLATFEGLEKGTYYIEETAAPDGYNRLTQDIEVKIATGDDGKLIAAVADIPNVTGTVLPTTGALGTKIFITLGAITALGAAVVLVANKRMANEEA